MTFTPLPGPNPNPSPERHLTPLHAAARLDRNETINYVSVSWLETIMLGVLFANQVVVGAKTS